MWMFTVSVQKAQAIKVNRSFYFPVQFEKCSTHTNKELIAPVRVWHHKSFLHETASVLQHPISQEQVFPIEAPRTALLQQC